MKKTILFAICTAALLLLTNVWMVAQSDFGLGSRLSLTPATPDAITAASGSEEPVDELLVELHTTLYDEDGESNSFTLALGSTKAGVTVEIDCGYGRRQFEVTVAELDEEQNISGSNYQAKVSRKGVIRVYGNPAEIDYVNASGCSVSSISFHPDLNLKLLNLEHNNIGKLDLNDMEELQVLYIMDNPFDQEPFNITSRLENLAVMEIAELGNIAPDFSISQFPMLMSFDAYHTRGLKSIDPSACPNLYRLSLEMTDVETVDVSQNLNLMVLNVSDTRVDQLDLSHNQELLELYCTHGSGTINTDKKFAELDLSHNPKLEYLFCGGNNLRELDLSHNPKLVILSAPHNLLENINLEDNPELYTVNLDGNKMNFATLPSPQETWGEYYYDEDELVLDDTYKEGDVIDFSSQVLRPGTTTTCALCYIPKDDPVSPQPLPADYYTFADGKVTLLKAYDGQLRLVFANSLLCDYNLYSEPFRVTTPEQFGQDVQALSISSITAEGAEVKMAIGIQGATTENPVSVKLDLGDGELTPYEITDEVPTTFNLTGKRTGAAYIRLFVPQDHYVTALKTEDLSISNIDLSELTELRVLSLVNADLYGVDLSYNAKLEELTISGNPYLTKLDLTSKTQYYYKGRMQQVDLSHNALTEVLSDDLYMMRHLDLSHNQLAEFDVTDADYLEEIDLSDNQIEVLQFNNSGSLQKANLSNNELYYLYITDEAPLQQLDVSGNKFAFGSMPENLWNLTESQYIYAPQQTIKVAASSPAVDLSGYYIKAGGAVTQYTWQCTDGTTLAEGSDYKINKGATTFLEPALGKTVYCEMTHEAYPQFAGDKALRTSELRVISKPTIQLASFVTSEDYELATVTLSATRPNTALYIDWCGDGNVTQYLLDSEQVIEAQAFTTKGAKVTVMADNEEDNFKVFSISDASMTEFDGSGLTEAILIGVEQAGLSQITLPASVNLKELKLSGNAFTELDLTPYPNLYYLGANGNRFTSFDFGQAPKMALAFLANNQLTEVTFKDNDNLWNLDLGCNQFSEISFEGAPNIEQLWLNGNKFETLDLSYLEHLLVLDIVDNYFTFATLAHFTEMPLNVFRYGKQADIAVSVADNQVDLSSQAVVCDSETTYRWFRGKPEFDENGELVGDELQQGADYTVENGITSFTLSEPQDDLVCMMSNEALPNLYLYTQPIAVSATSIKQVSADAATATSKELRAGNVIIRTADKVYNLYGILKQE